MHQNKILAKISSAVDELVADRKARKESPNAVASTELPVADCVELARIIAILQAVSDEGCPIV